MREALSFRVFFFARFFVPKQTEVTVFHHLFHPNANVAAAIARACINSGSAKNGLVIGLSGYEGVIEFGFFVQ